MAEGLYVEVVQGNAHVKSEKFGSILITELLNYAMPLIRYRIGDMGVLDLQPCPCGKGLPQLREIAGRFTDFLVGTDGCLVSGAVLTVVSPSDKTGFTETLVRRAKAARAAS